MDDSGPLLSFDELVRPLAGMPVTRAWNGYGSAICLDLGELHEEPAGNQRRLRGEAYVFIEWDWRAEFKTEIVSGSSSSRKSISRFLERLAGCRIQSIEFAEIGPELCVRLSNGVTIRSMVMHRADPQWFIRVPSGQILHIANGVLTDQPSRLGMTAAEQAECDLSESASRRWSSDPKASNEAAGQCSCCCYHVRLDASFHFHDFGVCACANSAHDGRVTGIRWTCRSFAPKDCDGGSE